MPRRAHRPVAGWSAGPRIIRPWAVAALAAVVAGIVPAPTLAAATLPTEPAPTSMPLHQRIDEVLDRGIGTAMPQRCSDEVFLRRLSLDLRGFAPTAEEVRAFAADAAPDKRLRLVDTFLADPHHQRHLTNVLDVLLMERRAEKNVKLAEWRTWLRQQVAARTPWDELVRRVLAAEGADEAARGPARWVLDREAEPNALARDVSRLFLGTDLSCAQCHDHPRVADYWQRDYQGLLAFFSRTYLFQPDPMKPAVVGERAEGETSFVSVFTKIGGSARPQLPGEEPVAEPPVAANEAWLVPPNEKDKAVRPVPKHSRRALLPEPLTSSRAFALNAANRFWAALLGRGVIEPLDLRHTANPPAADSLLDVLADGLIALKFDVSAYWREVALSRAYQANYDAPSHVQSVTADLTALQTAATAATETEHQTRRSETAAREAWEPLQLAAQSIESEAAVAAKAAGDARAPAVAAAAALAQARAVLTAKTEILNVIDTAASQCTKAASAVADAPELAQAAAVLQSRLTTLRTEHQALATDAAAKEADHLPKAAALAAAEMKSAEIAPRLTLARSKADAAWHQVRTTAAAAQAARDTARRATRDATRATTLAAAESAARQRQQAREQLAIMETTAQSVAAATASTQAACAKLPDDKELAAVLAQVQSRQVATTATLEASRQAAAAAEAAAAATSDAAVPCWTAGFALAGLTPLSPEQLCWSVARTTGILDQLRAQAAREWDEKNPAPATTADPARPATRDAAIQALTEEKIRPHEDQFVRLFGNGPGSPQSDFFATSDQALYFENAGVLRSWTQPGGGNLAERLTAITDPNALVQELFLAVLNRPPSQEEAAEITSHFASRPADQKAAALSDTLWALLTSAEYRFKH